MSLPVPPQSSHADAVRSDPPSNRLEDRPSPEFLPHVPPPGPHAPIEREIERSERASAALAATRALARAAFTDSQLAADDAAVDAQFDNSGWVRTEYAAFDHQVLRPEDGSAPVDPPRNLVGGSFNPGIATLHSRAFPGSWNADATIKTRTGAQARFLQESRRAERAAPVSAKLDPAPAAVGRRDGKAATVQRPRPADESFRISLGASVAVVGVLVGVGFALKAGLSAHGGTPAAALAPAVVPAAPIQAAAVVPASPQEIAVAPTAGVASTRSVEEANAALAAAVRAAAVPVASVHAAGPSRVARPAPNVAPASLPRAKDGVASAIADAQARADRFLASDGVAPAAAPAREVNQAP